jgi:hypothetical protein
VCLEIFPDQGVNMEIGVLGPRLGGAYININILWNTLPFGVQTEISADVSGRMPGRDLLSQGVRPVIW